MPWPIEPNRVDSRDAPRNVAMINCCDWTFKNGYKGKCDFESNTVNQGSAVKTKHLGQIGHNYPVSRPKAFQVWNTFDCKGRNIVDRCPILVMERHPYTTQTFIPLSILSNAPKYLVVIADDANGVPDLSTVRALLCHGGQGVTYGANQWHSPMIVLRQSIRFLVTNAENGTADDLEEYYIPEPDQPMVHFTLHPYEKTVTNFAPV